MFSKINRKYILQISITIIGCVMFSNCSKVTTNYPFVYEGFMYDSIGGAPSAGVQITINACVSNDARNDCDIIHLNNTTTEANGHFKVRESSENSNRYFISYTKNTYKNVQEKEFKDPKYTTLYIYHH
jgi:hypothetical protein